MKQTQIPAICPSIAAAAAVTDLSPNTFRALKRGGCPGFHANGSVNLLKILGRLASPRGRRAAPTLDLDQARAKLAAVQADKLERESVLACGELVLVGWVFDVLCDAFDGAALNAWVYERIPRVAFLFGQQAWAPGGIHEPSNMQEATRLLNSDAGDIIKMVGCVRTEILDKLRAGPPECEKETILGQTFRLLSDTAKALSPAARKEMAAALSAAQKQLPSLGSKASGEVSESREHGGAGGSYESAGQIGCQSE